ncbi:hypothetical protein BH09MYX1_BH09MYX1_22530 [soil metagenome]
METKSPTTRPDVTFIQSAPRPTPTPVRVNFADVLAKGAQGLVAGAQAALNVLPGGPLVAVALRNAVGGATSRPMGMSGTGTSGGGMMSPEGPTGTGTSVGGTGTGTGTGGTPSEGGVEGSLQQAQEMNMYYLQIQEQVNAQNRTFSTLSNVLKAEHDTVKTAIGNIR